MKIILKKHFHTHKSMKKIIALSVAVIMSIGITLSQSSVWEISKNGNTLYFGGSVHILRSEDYPLPKEFDMAFDNSDMLVLEADAGQMGNPEVAQKMNDTGDAIRRYHIANSTECRNLQTTGR